MPDLERFTKDCAGFKHILTRWISCKSDYHDFAVETIDDYEACAKFCARHGPDCLSEVGALIVKMLAAPKVRKAMPIINDLRERAGEADFFLNYLNPYKDGCVDELYEDNVYIAIIDMFRDFLFCIGRSVIDQKKHAVDVVVQPSTGAETTCVVLLFDMHDVFNVIGVLHLHHQKAWHFKFNNLNKLASEINITAAQMRSKYEELIQKER